MSILSPEVSIAIIAKDEERSIKKVLSGIFKIIQSVGIKSYELFLVDGYSNDNTAKIANNFGIKIFKVKGRKGDSIKKALAVAQGEYVLFIDADGSHMSEDIPRLIKTIKENNCDMVIVSRMLGRSEELETRNLDNILRLLGNRLSTFIVNMRWNANLTDIQNGFRIIKREVALELDLKESGFSIEQEMVMKCLKKNKKIIEIPGIEQRRLYGISKICKGKEFWKYTWSILKNF